MTMKNMMSLAEIEQVMQPEVAIPLTIGIAMLMYSIFYLFSYEEKRSKGGKKKSKASSSKGAADKPTRRSKREPKKPKNFDEDEEEVRKREAYRHNALS